MDHGLKFSDRRRHGNPYCLEDFAAHALALASDRHSSAIFFDGHLLKGFQVLLDVGPLEDVAGKVQFNCRSSSLRSTRARKLQKTWPRMVRSR